MKLVDVPVEWSLKFPAKMKKALKQTFEAEMFDQPSSIMGKSS